MRRLLMTVTMLGLLAAPALAKGPEVRWAKTWDEAKKEAKERNVPIHVSFHKDNCPRCTSMDSAVYGNKEFIAASKGWVNVYCNSDTSHGTEKVNGVEMCKLIPGMTCADHVACMAGASGGGYFKGSYGTPATVWCDVDGKEIGQQQGGLSAKQLIEKMGEAVKKLGPGLDGDTYVMMKDKLAVGEKAVADGKVKDAVDAYLAITKLSKTPGAKTFVDMAQVELDKLIVAGRQKITEAGDAKTAGNFENAKVLLRGVQVDFKGQPLAKEADKALAEVIAAEKAAKNAQK